MTGSKKAVNTPKRATKRPARTPEERENQLIALSMDLAEKRIRDGSATAQEVTHFLKLGSVRNQLELQKIERENKLLEAKVDQIESGHRSDDKLEEVLRAVTSYKGNSFG